MHGCDADVELVHLAENQPVDRQFQEVDFFYHGALASLLAHSEQFCSQVHCQRERGPAVPTAEPARTDHFKAVKNTEVTAWSGSIPDRGVGVVVNF